MATLAFKALPPSFRNPDIVTRFSAEIIKEYSIRWAFHTQPYAGIPTLLDALVRKRIKLAVLSNKPQPFTVEQIKSYYLTGILVRSSGNPHQYLVNLTQLGLWRFPRNFR